MANLVYYRGSEVLMEIGYQGHSLDKTSVATSVTPTESLRYIKSLAIAPNENIQHLKVVNGGNGRNIDTRYKKAHQATATMSFNIAKDMGQTDMQEGYFLSAAIDAVGTDSSNTYTFPATANEYGTYYLNTFTLEAGYNKSGSVSARKLTGCIVNQETMHIEEQQEILWTWNLIAQKCESITSFTGGSVAESTEQPFTWGDVRIALDDAAGGPTTIDGVEMFEHTINNNVMSVFDLANTSSTRVLTHYICGRRDIKGQLRLKLNTETHNGQDLWEDFFNDSSGTASPTEDVVLKDIGCRLYVDATYYVDYTYHNVVFDAMPDDFKGEGVAVITIPWTAQNIVVTIKANAGATEPTNWA